MNKKTMKNEDIKSVYRSLLFYIHHAVPGRLLTETALSLSKSCLGYFTSVIIIRKIIILVENGFIQFTYPLLVCFLSINILFSCVNLYYNHIVKPQKQVILQKAFYHMIVERTATISLAETEKDVFHTQADLIFKTLNKRVESVIANLNRISGAILSIVMAGITLIYIDYRFLAMGFLSILSLYFAKKYGKAISNRESQLASSTKAKKYYQELWLNKEFAIHDKLSAISSITDKYYHRAYNHMQKTREALVKHEILLGFASRFSAVSLVEILCYSILLFLQVQGKTYTLADYSVLFLAVINLVSRISRIITTYETTISYYSQIKELVNLLNLPIPQKNKSIVNSFSSLELNHVSFSYNSSIRAIEDISFSIKKGEKVAIVGFNGAGKTTLIKLILGLYQPSNGSITLNGQEVSNIDQNCIRQLFFVLFQDYYHYQQLTAEEFLLSGDQKDIKTERLRDIFGSSLFNVSVDPSVIIGREFAPDGTVLSGGQLQKLALGRIHLSDSDCIILDEPTASLDPISKEKIAEYIMNETKNRTLIIVTHHMELARKCDKIVFLENGSIAEIGSHETLIHNSGRYAYFWKLQTNLLMREQNE